jgi:hypothetical protein
VETRDEEEQARYLRELLDVFDAEGVDSTFGFTFAASAWPHRDDPREDLDRASYGIVKVLENRLGDTYADMAWEPKAAFTAVADRYRGRPYQDQRNHRGSAMPRLARSLPDIPERPGA